MTNIEPTCSTLVTRTDRWIVSLAGEIDSASRPELLSLVCLLSPRGDAIDFDLSEVRFIDCAGWASICEASEAAKAMGSSARIINPSSSVRHLTDLIARSHTRHLVAAA